MESQKPVVSEEMKTFLQEGLHTYASALVAVSEFRRQIRSRLQTVLEDHSTALSERGLPINNLVFKSARLDDQNLPESWSSIELEKNYGGGLYANYHVIWELTKPKERQVRVGVWIWLGTLPDRNRLFGALQNHQSLLRKTHLLQDQNGLSRLASYCDPDRFYSIDDAFQTLIEEWVELLSAIGGIRQFLSATSSRTNT